MRKIKPISFLLKQSLVYGTFWALFIGCAHYLMFYSEGPHESGFISAVVGTLLIAFVSPILLAIFCIVLYKKLYQNNISKAKIISFISFFIILATTIQLTFKNELIEPITITLIQYSFIVIITSFLIFPISFLAMYGVFAALVPKINGK